jgi:hypothetical protein
VTGGQRLLDVIQREYVVDVIRAVEGRIEVETAHALEISMA